MKITTTAIAALAMVVAACGSSTGTTAVHTSPAGTAFPTSTSAAQPAVAHGVEASIESIPWSQVGPGWMLATWSPASGTGPGEDRPPNEPSPDTATTTLYLVGPAGGRYPITTFPAPGDKPAVALVDWSGDGSRALFHAESAEPSNAVIVDLHTGEQTAVKVNGYPRFTRPDGKALLLAHTGDSDHPGKLARIDLTGSPQLTYPTEKLGSTFNGSYLSTPDGTRLVLGTKAGLSLMGNDGTVGSTLPVPGQTDCTPVRWWDAPATTILAKCTGSDSWYMSSLWQVPLDGGAPIAHRAHQRAEQRPGSRRRERLAVARRHVRAGARRVRPDLPRQAQRRRHHHPSIGAGSR
jgi:TolB protein